MEPRISEQLKVQVPFFVANLFSSAVLFCNSFVLGKDLSKFSNYDEYNVAWQQILAKHLDVLADAVSIFEPSLEAPSKLPPPPFLKSGDHRPVVIPISSYDGEDVRKRWENHGGHREQWRRSCSVNRGRAWAVSTALSLTLSGGLSWEPSNSYGILPVLMRIVLLADPNSTVMPVSICEKAGRILRALMLELAIVWAKKSTTQQQNNAQIVKSFFLAIEKPVTHGSALISGSLLNTRIVFEYESMREDGKTMGGDEAPVYAFARLDMWRGALRELLLKLAAWLAQGCAVPQTEGIDGGVAIEHGHRPTSSVAALFTVTLKLVCDLQYLSFTMQTGTERHNYATRFDNTMKYLSIERGWPPQHKEQETTAMKDANRPEVVPIRRQSVRPGATVRPASKQVNAVNMKRSIPNRNGSTGCIDKSKLSVCSTSTGSGDHANKELIFSPGQSTLSCAVESLEAQTSSLRSDSRYVLSSELLYMAVSQYLRPTVGAISDPTWPFETSLLVALHLYDVRSVCCHQAHDVMANDQKVILINNGCINCICGFLPLLTEDAALHIQKSYPGSSSDSSAMLHILCSQWMKGCRTVAHRAAQSCEYMRSILNSASSSSLDSCSGNDLEDPSCCKCCSDGTCTLSNLHETCSLLMALTEATRRSCPTSNTTTSAASGKWMYNAEEFSCVLALQMHGINVCWKLLRANIHEYCQNLIDWPVDVFLQVVEMLVLFTLFLKNTLLLRSRVEASMDEHESRALEALEGIVEAAVSATTDIKDSMAVAVRNAILSGENEGSYRSLFSHLREFPFDMCRRELVNILANCYD